ncbi:hypothetical protein RB195_014747 [Necator americanus]|uniref:Uncharacterized protein n=1 Tax=Necator americanus TaxID=51031 RepID=A0ABR1E1G5_NECAM
MTGYDTQSFIVESILHSVHMREPSSMDKHAGYYGQSMLYAAYTLATLFAPWACYQIGSKWTLFAGSALFTVYQAGFFMLNSYYYYVSQALMGIGFAMYYCGQGLYMSEHSTRASIARNSTLVSAIGNCSMLVGGVVMFIIFYIREQNKGANEMPSAIDTPIYRVTVCCILGLLNGAIDCCSCTMRALICTIAVPRKRLQAYSLAKLYQSAASCAAYFLSPHLTVRSWMMVLAGIQVFSSVGFIIVSKQILKEELIQKEGRRTCSQNKIRPAV